VKKIIVLNCSKLYAIQTHSFTNSILFNLQDV